MARIKTISGEQVFQVEASRFCIGATTNGYTLYYSADGKHFTPWVEGTLANRDQVVVGAAEGMYFKLFGNTDDNITITY